MSESKQEVSRRWRRFSEEFKQDALSLTACVLLIALWVRSYWWCNIASHLDNNGIVTTVGSNSGYLS
jgi:hypothetical protein